MRTLKISLTALALAATLGTSAFAVSDSSADRFPNRSHPTADVNGGGADVDSFQGGYAAPLAPIFMPPTAAPTTDGLANEFPNRTHPLPDTNLSGY